MVTIDFGACYKGYHSDQTCTFFLKEPAKKIQQTYEAIHAAQNSGFNALVQDIITGPELDKIVRDSLTDSGLGKEFTHGTGHGVGLEIHEAPSISLNAKAEKLEPGMVFTIEPGCYFPNQWGIRIEDTVYLTDNGLEKLTTIDKSLKNMIIG
jgi:Xaa-Pro aminopeptidase